MTFISGEELALFYSSILPLAGSAIQVKFMQPHAIAIGLPVAALGVIALGLRLSQFSGALSADHILNRMGEWGWLRLAPNVIVTGIIALGKVTQCWAWLLD